MDLRYGILSTSSIAPRFVAAVRAAQAGEIVALSSRSLEKAKEKAAQWDIPKAYGSHEELLSDPDVNIVYISTINAQHYVWAKAALAHNKHVVCEKPCTTTAAQTKELFALAREKGLFLMEAEKMLFLPAVEAVKNAIAQGRIGQVRMAEMSHSFSRGYNDWMLDPAAGGGTLLSSGIYAVHLIRWLFGDITTIRGTCSKAENGAEYQYMINGTAAGDVIFCIKNSTAVPLDNTAKFYGTDGWIELPEYWKARKAILHIYGKEQEVLEFPCEFELSYEAQHIQDCLQQGLLTSPVATEALSVGGIADLEAVKSSW